MMIEDEFLPPCSYCTRAIHGTDSQYNTITIKSLCQLHKAYIWIHAWYSWKHHYLNRKQEQTIDNVFAGNPRLDLPRGRQLATSEEIEARIYTSWFYGKEVIGYVNRG